MHRDLHRLARALAAATLLTLAAAGGAAGDDCDEPGCAADPYAAALALDGDVEAGRTSYQQTCAVCHLPDAAGRADGTFPRLAGQQRSVIVKQLIDIRDGRRANPIMQPHARQLLDAQQIADVASYVASLPVPPDPGRGAGDDLERGAELYARDCVTCHGASGGGDAGRTIPALGGQHYAYLLRQIRAVAAGRRGNRDAEMEHRIRDYSDAELRAVVDYASRLPGRSGEPTP